MSCGKKKWAWLRRGGEEEQSERSKGNQGTILTTRKMSQTKVGTRMKKEGKTSPNFFHK